jgi:hypothetical protein
VVPCHVVELVLVTTDVALLVLHLRSPSFLRALRIRTRAVPLRGGRRGTLRDGKVEGRSRDGRGTVAEAADRGVPSSIVEIAGFRLEERNSDVRWWF